MIARRADRGAVVPTDEFLFRGQPSSHWLRVRLSGDDEARWEAIDAIRHVCLPDESIPLLLDTLRNDQYWRARALAAHALCDLAWEPAIHPQLIQVMPDLVVALSDRSVEVREDISQLLELLDSDK